MVKPKGLPLTSLELYAARCGLLHDLSAESNLSISGRARPILYAWGNREVDPANRLLQQLSKREPRLNAVVLKVEYLVEAFLDGITLFEEDVSADPVLEREVISRAGKVFGGYDNFPGLR